MKVKNQYLKILEYLHLSFNKWPSIQYKFWYLFFFETTIMGNTADLAMVQNRGFQTVGRRVGQGGSHKTTWRQLNDTHRVPRAGWYTKINYELRYCSVRFSNRKGWDLKHSLRVLKRGRARVVITGSQSDGSLLKCSVRIINEKKLSHFTAVFCMIAYTGKFKCCENCFR